MGEFLDLIEEKGKWLMGALLITAFIAACSLAGGPGLGIAAADNGTGAQHCVNTCADAPRLGSFMNPNAPQMFGLTPDRGRVTFMFWNGVDRPSVLELGRMVNGRWTPYRVSVKFDRAAWPDENQSFAYLLPGAPQLVTMTTTDAALGDHVQVRAYWQSHYLLGQLDQFYPLAGADVVNIAA